MDLIEPIRLIATDLDGTLLNEHYEITPAVADAVSRARENGVQVVITTGRDRSSTQSFLDALHLADTFIGSGGAEIWLNGQVIKRLTLTLEQTQQILTKAIELGCGAFVDQLPNTWNFGPREYIDMYLHVSESTEIKEVEFFYDPLPNKVSIVQMPEVLDKMRGFITAHFPGLHLSSPFIHILDINPEGADKGSAVLHLAGLLGVKASQIATIGDSENDISMLEVTGLPFAVANAIEPLKQKARFIAPANSADGFAWMVNEILTANKAFK